MWCQPAFDKDVFTTHAWYDVDTALNRFILVGAFGAIRIFCDGRERDDTLDSSWTEPTQWVPTLFRWKKSTDLMDVDMGGITIGVGANSGTWGANTAGTNYHIGFLDSATDRFFLGNIAHPALYDVALSDADRDALFGGDNPLTVAADNLIHYRPWTEDGTGGYGATDYTLTGSPSFDADENPTVDDPPEDGGIGGMLARRMGSGIMFDRGKHSWP